MTTTDLVVVLPGIMGSTLARDGKLVWSPSAGALVNAVLTLGRNLKSLQLPQGIGDDHPGDGVTPVELVPDLHVIPGLWTPVKGYDQLLTFLRDLGYRTATADQPGNLVPFPYDWRLSNRYNGRQLKGSVEPALARWRGQGGQYADAQVVLVCHSMGGLVARWYLEQEGGAEVTRKLVTLGTPYRGALEALTQLIRGIPVKIGPILALDLTDFARSLPSLHQLLPEYACLNIGSGDLVRTTEVSLPDLDRAMVQDAMTFHTTLRSAEEARPASRESTHAIVGTKQGTATTASLDGSGVTAFDTYGPDNLYGDGTVPLAGAVRAGLPLDSPLLRRVADKHGNLHCNQGALDEIEGVLTGQDVTIRGGLTIDPRVTAPELLVIGEDLVVEVDLPDNHSLEVTVLDERGTVVETRVPRPSKGHARAQFDPLAPGGYTIEVSGPSTGLPISPVTSTLIVWDPAAGAVT